MNQNSFRSQSVITEVKILGLDQYLEKWVLKCSEEFDNSYQKKRMGNEINDILMNMGN